MKKNSIIAFFAVLALVVLNSCGPSLKVTSDYDKAATFTQYKTFQMAKLDLEHQSISQLNQDRIANSIKAEMAKKGFTENSSPDLFVNAIIILKDKQSVTANTNYYGYGGYYRPYGWGGGMSSGYTTYDVQNYKDGSLIIEVVDAKTQKLLWEGIGNKEIDKPIKDPDQVIPEAVSRIMASFPPGMTTKK